MTAPAPTNRANTPDQVDSLGSRQPPLTRGSSFAGSNRLPEIEGVEVPGISCSFTITVIIRSMISGISFIERLASQPVPPLRSISDTRSASASPGRVATITDVLRNAKSSAAARPMPLDAPVITTTESSSLRVAAVFPFKVR